MGELFMRYPIGSTTEHEGREYRIIGYEIYNSQKILVCLAGDEEYRIDVEEVK